jgi:PilZ domain-containing protein
LIVYYCASPAQGPGHRAFAMKELDSILTKLRAERRSFKRVRVDLPGRLFIPAEARESRCTVSNLSPGDAVIDCEVVPEVDAPIVLYIDGFGRFEGSVTRFEESSVCVRFNCTPLKRERIAEQLTLFLNKNIVEGSALRRHERAPAKGFTRFTRADGQLVRCEVLDLSTSGVSVKSDVRPPIGEYVLIGQMAGRIARHHETGVGIEFVGGLVERATAERVKTRLTIAS